MADDIAITAGSGTNVATDDCTGRHVQLVKLAYSADGTATHVTADADGVLVNLGTNNDITGTVTANAGTNLNTSTLALEAGGNLAGAATSLAIIDDWDETDRAKVNPIVGQAGVAAGSGVVGVTTQRVVLATDVALPAGTNNIGDVDILSIAAGDNNIGNVDIVTMPNVTIGTMAALVAGTANIGDVDVLTLPNVTLAAGTNTNEVVGDVAHSAGIAGNPITIGGVSQDTDDTAPPNRVDAEADATRLATDRDGALFVRPHGPQVWSYHLNTSTAQTDVSVHAAPGAGLSLYVGTIVFSSGAATAINMFLEEGASTIMGPFYLEAIAGRGMAITFNPPRKVTANTALTITTSASIAHSVEITGFTAQG